MKSPLALVARKVRNFAGNLRRLGLRETLRLYRYRLGEYYRDWRLGIRTTGLLYPDATEADPDYQPYEAAHYRCLHQAMRYFDPHPERDVLLDYGCGLGRAVVVGALYPFRKVIGVELSAELSQAARQNVRRAAPRLRCSAVEIVTADAAEYQVPPEVNCVFLFNPFTGPVLRAVLDRLHHSWLQHPRKLRLVYLYPSHEPNLLEECHWLEAERELGTFDWEGVRMIAYASREPARLDTAAAEPQNNRWSVSPP